MANPQETEFTTFGIVNKTLRAGILVGLLALSITSNIYLVSSRENTTKDLYEKMIARADEAARERANQLLKKPIENLNEVNAKADTVLNENRAATKRVMTVGDSILKKTKNP